MQETIQAFRSFNRFYTRLLGLLNRTPSGLSAPLAEARALFEINNTPGLCAAELSRSLGMDRSQLSRILARLIKQGHVQRQGEPAGRKSLPLFITAQGRELLYSLEQAATEQAASLLEDLSPQQLNRLREALQTVQTLLGRAETHPSTAAVTLREADSGDLGWIIARHAEYYGREFGFSRDFEAYVLRTLAEHLQQASHRSRIWIAEQAGVRLGSMGVVQVSDTRAQLRWLLVEPEARGLGLGKKLFTTALEFCKACGYQEAFLWTIADLGAARTLYTAQGLEIIESKPGIMGGKEMIEECWACKLEHE